VNVKPKSIENNDLSIAVVGYGNMGRRHVDSLLGQGVNGVVLVRRDPAERVDEAHAGLERFGSLRAAWDGGLDGVVICTPPVHHKEAIEFCIDYGLPLLTEKPIVADWKQAVELAAKFAARPTPTVVGYDLRFAEPVKILREWVNTGRLGPILLAQLEAGGYLPDWRPQLDYRRLYSASLSLGGGVALDLVHELDSMRLFFGEPSTVMGSVARRSNLHIDSDDVVSMIFEYESGPTVTVVLDYLRRPVERRYKLIGEMGTVTWEAQLGKVTVNEAGASGSEVVWDEAASQPIASTSTLKIGHFLDVVKGAASPCPNFWDGINSVGLVEAAKSSSRSGRRRSADSFMIASDGP